ENRLTKEIAMAEPDGTNTYPCLSNPHPAEQKSDKTKTHDVNIKQFCVLAFPYSLTGKAHRWWVHEWNSKITSWVEIVDKFFYKYYPLSRASKSNDAKVRECHLRFMNWLTLKFKNHWKLSSATKNALWNFWEKGYDNDKLDYDEESSDDECNNGDHCPLFDHHQNDNNKGDENN
ncbi:hypothetical protein Tco_0482488, partial [Tanacetum coccineum]